MTKLTTSKRNALAPSEFAVPSKAPGSGSYPIPDRSHARNALARVAQHGTPSEKAEVRSAVREKFPAVGSGGHSGMDRAVSEHADRQHPVQSRRHAGT
jgi:hypothetical protein